MVSKDGRECLENLINSVEFLFLMFEAVFLLK